MAERRFSKRRSTLAVNIGGIFLGSDYPVRIQSMANTPTSDIKASVAQCIRIANAGAEYVRFTVPSPADAEAFGAIREILRKEGYNIPLIADVHFNPDIALRVADHADKVRINPGNFTSAEKFIQLVEKCRAAGKVIRVGVNHGSLSSLIMDKYGDTPEGMAESAMEYLRICRNLNFDKVVVSMKSSNVRVMIHANRLIAAMMHKEDMNFPLHLGVTEAGEGEDGRIKSAVGIGTLLAEGLGDTIRVSLTEDPEAEIPVARRIVEEIMSLSLSPGKREERGEEPCRYEYVRRKSRIIGNIGGGQIPVVYGFDRLHESKLIHASEKSVDDEIISLLSTDKNAALVYTVSDYLVPPELNMLRKLLEQKSCDAPVIFRMTLNESSEEDFMIRAAVSLGGAFVDGFGDGIWLENEKTNISPEKIISTALGILQACRARMSKTEFIACPSCGRTNFNLMDTLARIKKATGHLKGLKIGVMGCIVNGPGEMADADYGYVGSGNGKVTLYKAREIVKKGISEDNAVEELISLIRENGDWVEVC